MSDFLAENNLCGQTLLSIVSRGNTILAQLFRLRDNLPQIFKLDSKQVDHHSQYGKYSELIIDLRYFSQVDEFERKIELNPILQELDNELRESYTEILSEFYNLFESIYKYVIGLNKFVEDVQDGLFIQCSLESILWNVEGRQLLVESVYLYGTMLLLIDRYIDGPIRERMLTSFYRYAGAQAGAGDTNLDDVCKLLRSTNRKSGVYPTDYFGRVELNSTLISMLLGRLRSDDIYNQLSSYPLPEHRSTALGSQASILVIILTFAPAVLQSDIPTMREICDKFFHDNWILPIYMGTNINLLEFWKDFRAAKAGLEICQIPTRIGADRIPNLIEELSKVLKEGFMTEDNVLERIGRVIGLLREANVVLRWTMLHCGPLESEIILTKKSKQFRDAILLQMKYDPEIVLSLLLHVAQLELRVKELYKKLLEEKQSKWLNLKSEAKERIVELAEVFSGTKPLSRIEKNDALSVWLQTKAIAIESLEFERLNYSGRKIIELIRAFDDMLEYHNLESLVQVREWVADTTACLHKMLRTGAVNEDMLVTLQIISDLGYAWGRGIDLYTPQMQGLIKKDPTAVSKLRAVFLKLASAMDMPLLRLSTATKLGSKDLLTVSNYYSGELVSYVQKVLQIIPESVFSLLHQIIQLQTHSIQELPTRLDKDKVKDFAQLEYRQQVSRLTHDMSVLTEGILMMQTTLVGIIKIDPKELLENGIRKELVRQLMLTLSGPFSGANSINSLIQKLEQIAQRIQGIRRSFEYIGDYVNTNGLQIYQEELGRVLNFTIEQEINQWKKIKILPFSSIYQSKQVPISLPRLQDDGSGASTFLGKLVNELLTLTEPKSTIYLASTNSWYEAKAPNNPILIPDNFKLLENAVDIVGMSGIDKVLCFLIAKELEKLTGLGQREVNAGIDYYANLHSSLQPPSKIQLLGKYATTPQSRTQAHLSLLRIGQLQILRKRIQYQLQVSSSLNAKQLKSSILSVNRLASELLLHQNQNENHELVEEISIETLAYSEPLGIYEPLTKIYLTLKPIQFFPLYLALITIHNVRKLQYVKSLGTIKSKRVSDGIDGLPFTIGFVTILAQCHPSQTILYLSYVCQYMNSLIVDMSKLPNPKKDVGEELGSIYYYLKLFLRYNYSEETERYVKMLVPSFDTLPTLVNLLS